MENRKDETEIKLVRLPLDLGIGTVEHFFRGLCSAIGSLRRMDQQDLFESMYAVNSFSSEQVPNFIARVFLMERGMELVERVNEYIRICASIDKLPIPKPNEDFYYIDESGNARPSKDLYSTYDYWKPGVPANYPKMIERIKAMSNIGNVFWVKVKAVAAAKAVHNILQRNR